jgi:hypothetical protein
MIRIFSDENGFIAQLSVLESNPLTLDTAVKVDPILPQGYFKLLSGTDANRYNEKDYMFGLQAHHQCTTLYETGFHYTYYATYKAPPAVTPGVYWLQSNANSLLIPHDDGWVLVEALGSEVQARNLLSTAFDFIAEYDENAYSSKKDCDYKDEFTSDITWIMRRACAKSWPRPGRHW